MIPEAVHYYHELLSEKYLQSTVEKLDSMRDRLVVANRPVCTVLRPYFIQARTYSSIKHASTLLMRAITTLCRHLLEDSNLRKQMELTPVEETIIRIDTGYGPPDVSARLDGFLADDGHFAFVEYNPDSPGGIGYGDVLSDCFTAMPLMTEFSKRYPFQSIPVRSFVFESLMHAYHRWGGKGLPSIGIIDWKEAATRPEFDLFREFFEKQGCSVIVGDPRNLEYTNGRLYLQDFPIDLVYKRLVVAEMLKRLGTENALVQAARDRAVCVANGFGVQLAFRKNLFALLTDPSHFRMFDTDIQHAIRTHVPWTRSVHEGKTTYEETVVDLLPFILQNRERLVLKPGADYGGKGVVLGWEVSREQWEEALNLALKSSYVVQERVRIGSEMFPSMEAGELIFTKRYFDLDPYVWNAEQVEGCGVRLSRGSLLNVAAGGGSAAPLFILQ